jgi:hypothetical protein
MFKKLRIVAAMPLLTGIVVLGTASGASADPSIKGSCVAQALHYYNTTPGQVNDVYQPFGQAVSWVSHVSPDVCSQYFVYG